MTPLSELRTLKLHLDFPEMPGPMIDRYQGDTFHWRFDLPRVFDWILQDSVATFAQTLTPCIREVWCFIYRSFLLEWRIYDVVRSQADDTVRTTVVPLTHVIYETEVSVQC